MTVPTKILGLILLVVALAAPAAALRAQTTVASSGREFFVVLPSVEFGFSHRLRINITATNTATVTLAFTEYGTSESMTIPAGGRWERVVPVDSIVLLEREYRSNRSIRITSTEPVTVIAVDDAFFVSEAYLVLPTESLGFDYLAVSYPGITHNPEQPSTKGGVVAIVAAEDETTVRITPTVGTTGGNGAGFEFAVTLDRGEVYQLLAANPSGTDLSGTVISASRPVGVISGHRGVAPDPVSAINPLLEQAVPVADWGTKFYSVKLPEQTRGRYRVLAETGGTEVRVNGLRVATLAAGSSTEFTTDGSPVIVETTRPVLLTQIGTHRPSPSSPAEIDSDPSMSIVNPIDSYAERFEWSTPSIGRRPVAGDSIGWRHWAIITAPTAVRSSVRLDGAPVSFTLPHGDGVYWSAQVSLTPGAHRVSASAPVNVQLVGDSHYDTYATPAGMRLREPLRAPRLVARTCAVSLDTTITLRNAGGSRIDVTATSFASGTASVRTFPTGPFSVAAGGSRLVGIRVSLPRYGTVRDTLVVSTTGSGTRPLRIPIEIVRDSLAIESLERAIVFAPVTASSPTRDTTVRIANTGTGPLTIPSIALTGPFSLVAPSLPVTVAAGDTIDLVIRFAPQAPGAASGNATIAPSPCGAAVGILLSGSRLRGAGIDVPAVVVPELGCDDAGSVDVPVVIRSTGEEPLHFDSVEIRGPGAAMFSVTAPPAGTIVPPGDSIVAQLRFAPVAAGSFMITLRIWNGTTPGGYLLTAPINARRVAPIATPDQRSLDFGTLGACAADSALTITVTNTGTQAMSLGALGTATGAFIATTDATEALEPGESATIGVRYAPPIAGEHHDTLRVAIDPCDTSIAIPLAGARESAALAASIDTLDLGVVADCDLPATGDLTLTNTGTIPLDLSAVEVTGTGFVLRPPASARLVPGEAIRLEVELTGADGSYIGAIVARAEPCDVVVTIPVRGAIARVALGVTGALDVSGAIPGVPMRRAATLRNDGGSATTVDELRLSPPVAGLTVLAPETPFALMPGEEIEIVAEYASDDPVRFDSELLVIGASPCPIEVSIDVRSDAAAPRVLGLTLPDTTGWVDTRVTIPLRARRASESGEGVRVRAELRWDRTMLALDRVTTPIPGGTIAVVEDRIEGTERVVVLEYDGALPLDAALAELEVVVLIGAADRTPLRIAAASATATTGEAAWEVTSRDGSFGTLGICHVGGGRFVRIAGTFVVKGTTPNPARDGIVVALESDARARVAISLVDALGRTASTGFDDELPGGRSDVRLDVSSLAPGLYQLEVRSGRHVERVPVIVAR